MTRSKHNCPSGSTMQKTVAGFCCAAAAAFILMVRTLSLSLGVLLTMGVLVCVLFALLGILIMPALPRLTPQSERT